MKKLFFLIGTAMSLQTLVAQDPTDALRYSWTVPGGTARQQAVGGAMTSLGGDISANFINPAGLAFYRTGDLVISPLLKFEKNKSTYLNRTEKDNNTNFNLGTSGFVAGSGYDNSKKRSFAFSIAISRSADFNSDILYRGENNKSSYSQVFLEQFRNNNVNTITEAGEGFTNGASLAFNTYWLDPVYDANGNVQNFVTRSPTETLQEQRIKNRGGINELAFGGAVNLNDKLYIGGGLGIPFLRHEREATFTEADATADETNGFNYGSYWENVVTKGAGLNLKAGLIYKPVEFIRLGLAFHSPTFYSLTYTHQESVTTDTENYQGLLSDYSIDYNGGQPEQFKYLFITPLKVMASASYVLREIEDVTKQRGFLTADVEYVNHGSSRFQADDELNNPQSTLDYLSDLNSTIKNIYKSTFNFKVGGELKFTTIMVRAGAAYFGNPYKNINGEKGDRLNLSGGLGYRNKGMFIDLTYVHAMTKDVHFPYRLQYSAYEGANIRSTASNVLMTLGFKF